MPVTTSTAMWIAAALWFATVWYLDAKLDKIQWNLDLLFDQFNGLREYLYEIDPQFDEERQALRELDEAVTEDKPGFAGLGAIEFLRGKREREERTLNTSFASDQTRGM